MALNNYKIGTCEGCGNETYIVYKKGGLCNYCNQKRKAAIYKERQKGKPLLSEKAVKQIRKDEQTYAQVWDSKPHFCEECTKFLGDYTAKEAIKLHREYFSHILKKSLYGKIRNDIRNFNLLCFDCHNLWEKADTRKLMKIWDKNKDIMIELLKEYGYKQN